MKKISFLTLCLLLSLTAGAQKAKYIFYFIGDGMGVNQVNGTESWLAASQGRIGIEPLCFASFPYTGLVTTYSGTNGVTDSAASGTALAAGCKTKNGAIGVTENDSVIYSVAQRAKDAGMKVAVTTTVCVDHATPSAFYAHRPSRNQYHHIGHDLITAGYDFYAGSSFYDPICKEKGSKTDLFSLSEEAGYTIAKGYADYEAKSKDARRMLLFQSDSRNAEDRQSLPYAIDQDPQRDLNQQQIVHAAIDFMMKDKPKKGFLLMSEGGKIDFACHVNDAGAAFRETVDMDNAVKEAYEFYKKHPKETLIVVTADHETGGLVLGLGQYKQNLGVLDHQKLSVGAYTRLLQKMRRDTQNHITWEMLKKSLEDNFGFYTQIPLDPNYEAQLKKVYHDTMEGKSGEGHLNKSLYQADESFATTAVEILNRIAMVGWVSGSHSNGYVPVFAIGAGAEQFTGRIDNTDIPKRIAKAAGLKW